MKIPQSNTTMTLQYINEPSTNQVSNLDADSNQIRDKLRKKKIVKEKSKQGSKGLVNQKQRRKEFLCGKKSKNSVQLGNAQKPSRKAEFPDTEQNQDTSVGHEAVSQFFQNELSKYYPGPSQISKATHRYSKKISQQFSERAIESYLNELSQQNEIKVAGLLQDKEKLLFKNTKLSEKPKHEQDALDFLQSIKKKQQKQNCEFYNASNRVNKLQKRLQLILQHGDSYQNSAYYYSGNSLQPNVQNLEKISLLHKYYLTEARTFEKVWENDLSAKINQPNEQKHLAKMLLVLAKSYKSNNKRVKEILNIYKQQQQKHIVTQTSNHCLSQSLSNNQFYIKCMIKKCLIKTFSEQQTLFTSDHQLWNHFKLTSYLEQNIIQEGYRDNEKYLSLDSEDEYKEYMKRIKNKKIIYKPSLHTNCKGCFSNYFERSNPIVKCPECKSRLHKYCGKIDDRCDKCSYKKLGASLKADTPKCFICHNDSISLMLHKLKGTKFVHNFCMLVHNLWTVSNDRLTFTLNKRQETQNGDSTKSLELVNSTESVNSLIPGLRKPMKTTSIIVVEQRQENSFSKEMADQSQEINNLQRIPSCKQNRCKFCTKFSQKEYLKQCKNCQQSCHVLCAYLNGCQMDISGWKNTFEMDLSIKCCSLVREQSIEYEDLRAKRQMCRKYRLNYERYALNYGFENEYKTSKVLESCCNIAQVEQQWEQQMDKEAQKFDRDHILSSMKDESQEDS